MNPKISRAIFAFLFSLLLFFTPGYSNPEKPATQEPVKPPEPFKPYAEVTKDTEKFQGLFTAYKTRDGKLFLEVLPAQLESLFLFSITLSRGMGGHGILSGYPLDNFVFRFHRVNDQLQFIQKNPYFKAASQSPAERSVQKSFADSIPSALKILSINPENKGLVVEADDLFFSDLGDVGRMLSQSLKGGYSLDPGKSSVQKVEAFPLNVEVETEANYAAGAPPKEILSADSLVSWRSIPLGVHYSLSALPQEPYVPRLSDDRVGYFVTAFRNFSSESPDTNILRYIDRWNLAKKPIVFWIENSTPVEYRDAIAAGVLEWNKAFEKAGIPQALEVKVQPDDAEWNPADIRYNVIRWISSSQVSFAGFGPVRVNPLTGEIYNASVVIDGEAVRRIRLIYEYEVKLKEDQEPAMRQLLGGRLCLLPQLKAREGATLALALALRSPNPAHFQTPPEILNAYLKDLVMHEIGHCLGLRHNFHGSTMLSLKSLRDPAVTRTTGLSASVMDYVPVNLATKNEKEGELFSSTLGKYDNWAILYGYTPAGTGNTESERPALSRITSRAPEEGLAYATDEDTYTPFSVDPEALIFDLSNNPLGFAEKRYTLYRELWGEMAGKLPYRGEGFDQTRRAFDLVFSGYAAFLDIPIRYVGGQYFSRNHRGDPQARPPLVPISRKKQLEALQMLDHYLFQKNAFVFSPQFLNKLAPERNSDHFTELQVFLTSFDYPIRDRISDLMESALGKLFRPILLSRLLENSRKVSRPQETLTLDDLFQWMTGHFWEELDRGQAIADVRRELQRAHLRHLVELVVEPRAQLFAIPELDFGPMPLAGVPADARSLAEEHLEILKGKIRTALGRGHYDNLTRAHLRSSLKLINKALEARMHQSP